MNAKGGGILWKKINFSFLYAKLLEKGLDCGSTMNILIMH